MHFQTKMSGLIIDGDRVGGIVCGDREFRASAVVLAIGHSARDVYRYLASEGIDIEAKGIAVGVRLEHPAHLIDQIQYHRREGRGRYLPAAEYSMVCQSQERGVYSFCMCPGGFVVPAASGPEQEVRPGDVTGNGALAMMEYQEQLERMCWLQGNQKQTAPAQRMADFVNKRLSADLPASSYAPGLIASPLHFWLPESISGRLREAFLQFGRRHHGFLTNEATMIAVETRTSAPVRILRESDTLQHVRIRGLYPCGEGAGYAGGIVSAGVDGERCADAIGEQILNNSVTNI